MKRTFLGKQPVYEFIIQHILYETCLVCRALNIRHPYICHVIHVWPCVRSKDVHFKEIQAIHWLFCNEIVLSYQYVE